MAFSHERISRRITRRIPNGKISNSARKFCVSSVYARCTLPCVLVRRAMTEVLSHGARYFLTCDKVGFTLYTFSLPQTSTRRLFYYYSKTLWKILLLITSRNSECTFWASTATPDCQT